MFRNKAIRMKAMDAMSREKPDSIDKMRRMKIEQRLQQSMGDIMQPAKEIDEEETQDYEDMNLAEKDMEGFISMPVSPEEKKMLLAYRKHQKMKSMDDMDEEEMA